MEYINFQAFQFLGEVALGLLGFSAILIGLARVDDGGFSPPDRFRVKLLLYAAWELYSVLSCRLYF